MLTTNNASNNQISLTSPLKISSNNTLYIQPQSNGHLKNNAQCMCQLCCRFIQKHNPQILIDEGYQKLKSQKSKILTDQKEKIRLMKGIKDQSKLRYSSLSILSMEENDMESMNTQVQINTRVEGYTWYLKQLAKCSKTLPNFPILDIMILEKGYISFYIYTQPLKTKIQFNSSFPLSNFHTHPNSSCLPYNSFTIKKTLLQRKSFYDIEYQKKQFKQINPKFQFTQLEHQSQKQINNFQKKIQFIDKNLNRVVIVKEIQQNNSTQHYLKQIQNQKNNPNISNIVFLPIESQEKILSKYEFGNLFDKARVKVCQLQEIQYLQIFPVLYGQEQHSYVKQAKYFRKIQEKKTLFKQAQGFVLAWLQKNQSLQKLQEVFIQTYFYNEQNLRVISQYKNSQSKRLKEVVEQEYLMYQVYKLMLHFQAQTNNLIQQALIQFITNDQGSSFYLKNIKYIKYSTKHQVQIKNDELPKYKHIDKQDYISNLSNDMKQVFQSLEHQYKRLDKDWYNFEKKWQNDKDQSNRVFRQVRERRGKDQGVNFHVILNSNNRDYKEKMLGINQKVIGKKGNKMIISKVQMTKNNTDLVNNKISMSNSINSIDSMKSINTKVNKKY